MPELPLKMKLRPFQKRVFEALMSGENVILQAPTGAGKTRAALAPFLQNLAYSHEDKKIIPQTCRYAVPLRVLARQFFNEYHHTATIIDRTMNTQLCKTYNNFGQKPVQIQTGEQPDDPHFESALTFCTIDQLLASFLAIPYSVSGRNANMNVGAIIGSYLVLDEFHLYPISERQGSSFGARTTVLHMLEMLNGRKKRLAPFTLMTATFSSHLLDLLSELLDAKKIQIKTIADDPDEPSELEVLNDGRMRRFFVQTQPMIAESIVDSHQECSLVICNTVLRAQRLFLEIKQILEQLHLPTKIILLHSRFTDSDRETKQQLLEQALGKQAWDKNTYLGPDIIIVATQVVEVGMDISARTLHSEIAPANSIIQRAGRCARFGQQHGNVYLYPLAKDINYLPYHQESSLATLDAFKQFDGAIVGFVEEQHVIDAVHTEEDRQLLEIFHKDRGHIHKKMFNGLAHNDRGIAPELIRKVAQISLLIHPDPNNAITERPWEWQSFAMQPYSFQGQWDILLEIAAARRVFGDDSPIAWQARLIEEKDHDQEARIPDRYAWDPIITPQSVISALMTVLSPDIATYDSEIGFRLNNNQLPIAWPTQPYISPAVPSRKSSQTYEPYEQETYAEHIHGLLSAYNYTRLRGDLQFGAARLEKALQLAPGSIDRTVRLAIACHDIGKLGIGWQTWASEWQKMLYVNFPQEQHYQAHKVPFAHTDYDWKKHREVQRIFKVVRPNHACESAYLSTWLIAEITGNKVLTQAATAAIARHHTPQSAEYQPIQLIRDAPKYITEMIQVASRGEDWSAGVQKIATSIQSGGQLTKDWMIIPNEHNELETWLYYLIVRILRLADWRSFDYKNT